MVDTTNNNEDILFGILAAVDEGSSDLAKNLIVSALMGTVNTSEIIEYTKEGESIFNSLI